MLWISVKYFLSNQILFLSKAVSFKVISQTTCICSGLRFVSIASMVSKDYDKNNVQCISLSMYFFIL